MVEFTEFSPDYLIVPGESISEMLDVYAMTQKELASRMNLTEKTVSKLMKGNSPITQKHASSLESILELPSTFWLNLQRDYDDALYEIKRNEELTDQIEIAERFPQDTLKSMGLLPKGRNKGIELVKKLLDTFKVQNLNQVLPLYSDSYNCRIFKASTVDEYALVTWMRLGELEIEKRFDNDIIPSFDSDRTLETLERFRKLSIKTDPSIFLNELESECFNLGILFIVVPEIKGSRITGMARWKSMGRRKIPIIQLSLRGKRHDIFWFTFFHELGHILFHQEDEEVFVDVADNGERNDEKELEANYFAKNILIPEIEYNTFLEVYSKSISRSNIEMFSKEINIHPGIVVGRLQKEGILGWNRLHELKVTYEWNFENNKN